MTRNASLIMLMLLANLTCTSAAGTEKLGARVGPYNGRPVIFVNGNPTYPMIYALTEGGRFTWEDAPQRNLKHFSEIGFTLFQIDTWFRDIWKEDGSLDMEFVKRQVRATLQAAPPAAIMFRLHMDAPPWWCLKHPDEITGYAGGDVKDNVGDIDRARRQSLASALWLKEATAKLREFCKTLSASPEGDRIIGFHIAGGVYGEWHYWGFPEEPDTGPAMTRRFRSWLKARYGDSQRLRKAWNDPHADLETTAVPDLAERRHTSDGVFRDPALERHVIDYYTCHQQAVADAVLHFCRIAKESWPRPIITGAFYGYFFYHYLMTTGGHLEMGRVLNSPYIDYLAAPAGYEGYQRWPGGSGQLRALVESIRLHGKLYINEEDNPTHLGDPFERGTPLKPDTPEISIAMTRRNAGQTLTRGAGMWWYDFGPEGRSGWWDYKAYLDDIAKIKRISDEALARPYMPAADVLFVYDTNCFYYLGLPIPNADTISADIINRTSDDAYHSGAVFDTVLLMDLPRVDLSQYKVVVFANTFLLADPQVEFVTQKVAKEGRTLIWLYAPGYTDGHSLDIKRVTKIIRVNLDTVNHSSKATVEVKPANPILPGISARFGLDAPVRPMFAVKDKDSTAVGCYQGTNEVALAYRKGKDFAAWYCALPLRDPALIRAIFQKAGAHIYDEDGDVVFAGAGLLVIHTHEGGHRKLNLAGGKTIEINLAPDTTTFLDQATGRVVLK